MLDGLVRMIQVLDDCVAHDQIKTIWRKRIGLYVSENFDFGILVVAQLRFIDVNDRYGWMIQ